MLYNLVTKCCSVNYDIFSMHSEFCYYFFNQIAKIDVLCKRFVFFAYIMIIYYSKKSLWKKSFILRYFMNICSINEHCIQYRYYVIFSMMQEKLLRPSFPIQVTQACGNLSCWDHLPTRLSIKGRNGNLREWVFCGGFL